MPNVFNSVEVVDMGIAKEKKRRDFYGLAAARFRQKDMKELFTKLKAWEETHIKKFTEIRDGMEGSEIAESYQGEFASYIKALADDMLYDQVSSKTFTKNVKSPLSAISYGIGFEKDAILFFTELLNHMTAPHQEKVQGLIDEERKHLIYLTELKRKYK